MPGDGWSLPAIAGYPFAEGGGRDPKVNIGRVSTHLVRKGIRFFVDAPYTPPPPGDVSLRTSSAVIIFS